MRGTVAKRQPKVKILPDVMSATVWGCRYVTSHFTKNRRLVLRGVGLALDIRNGKIKECGVVYPRLGPLCRLVEKRKEVSDFTWDGKRWKVTPVWRGASDGQ